MIRNSAWIGSIAALFGLAVAGWLNAADDADNPRAGSKASTRAADRSDSGQDASGQTDRLLVQCLIIDNEGETALAQFAQQRTKNEEVKAFAAMMIDEHSAMLDKLRSAADASQAGVRTNPGTEFAAAFPDQDDERAEADDADDQPRADDAASDDADDSSNADPDSDADARDDERPQDSREDDSAEATTEVDASANGAADHAVAAKILQIKKELGEQCLKTTQSELSAKKGPEFDKCYMTQQVMAHLHMIDTMTVYKNHASPTLQSLLDEGISTAQSHLTHAKDLCKKCEAQTGAKAKPAKRSAANQ